MYVCMYSLLNAYTEYYIYYVYYVSVYIYT